MSIEFLIKHSRCSLKLGDKTYFLVEGINAVPPKYSIITVYGKNESIKGIVNYPNKRSLLRAWHKLYDQRPPAFITIDRTMIHQKFFSSDEYNRAKLVLTYTDKGYGLIFMDATQVYWHENLAALLYQEAMKIFDKTFASIEREINNDINHTKKGSTP